MNSFTFLVYLEENLTVGHVLVEDQGSPRDSKLVHTVIYQALNGELIAVVSPL